MQVKIVFRSMDKSQALENYVHEKIVKFEKFLHRESSTVAIDVVLEAHRDHKYFIGEIRVNTQHFHLISKDESSDMYKTIDSIVDKMARELSQAKKKLVESQHGTTI